MTNEEKDKTIQKWSALGLTEGLTNQIDQLYGNQLSNNQTPSIDSFEVIQFPTVKKISRTTIGGGWVKSKKQQLKEDRINKLRKIKGLKPNVVLEKDQWVDGLVSVQPLSAPSLGLFYADIKYNDERDKI